MALAETHTDGLLLSHESSFIRIIGPMSFITFASIKVSVSEDLVLWLSSSIMVIAFFVYTLYLFAT